MMMLCCGEAGRVSGDFTYLILNYSLDVLWSHHFEGDGKRWRALSKLSEAEQFHAKADTETKLARVLSFCSWLLGVVRFSSKWHKTHLVPLNKNPEHLQCKTTGLHYSSISLNNKTLFECRAEGEILFGINDCFSELRKDSCFGLFMINMQLVIFGNVWSMKMSRAMCTNIWHFMLRIFPFFALLLWLALVHDLLVETAEAPGLWVLSFYTSAIPAIFVCLCL